MTSERKRGVWQRLKDRQARSDKDYVFKLRVNASEVIRDKHIPQAIRGMVDRKYDGLLFIGSWQRRRGHKRINRQEARERE